MEVEIFWSVSPILKWVGKDFFPFWKDRTTGVVLMTNNIGPIEILELLRRWWVVVGRYLYLCSAASDTGV